MDGTRFDSLTRRLAQPLSRRWLLGRAAGLAGVLLAGRAARVAAITCPPGHLECDDRCCDPDYECIGVAPNRDCRPPCTGTRCSGGGCCDGVAICCPQNKLQGCCPADYSCCRGAGASECCPASPDWHCLDMGDGSGNHICLFCPGTHTLCGGASCCAPGFVCEEGPGFGVCIPCPPGATKCGAKHCCTAEETCGEDGKCVAACPVGGAARRGVAAEAGCEPPPEHCPKGTVKCGDTCVPRCTSTKTQKRTLDGDTCKCTKKTCPKGTKKCGGKCVDTQTDANHCGGCSGTGGLICADAPCCHGQCVPPGATCCGDVSLFCRQGEECCGKICCGRGESCADPATGKCCPNGQEACGKRCCLEGTLCADEARGVCCPQDHPFYCAKSRKCVARQKACK